MMALMFVTVTGMAKEPKIVSNGSTKSFVFELDAASDETTIRLLDSDGNIIYSEQVSKGMAYAKRFDLNNLESGNYYLEVEDSIKELTYRVALDETGAKVGGLMESTKPVFRKRGDKVFLNLLNLDLQEVEVSVYDSSDRILFSETIKGEQLVQKAFNFEKAYTNSYTVVVKDGDNTYYEEVVVK